MTLHPLEGYALACRFVLRVVLIAGEVAAVVGDDGKIRALLIPSLAHVWIVEWFTANLLIIIKLVAILPVDRMALSPWYRRAFAILVIQH